MKNILVAAAFVVAWSSGFVGATMGDRAANPAALLAWRYLVALAILIVVVVCHPPVRRELQRLPRLEWLRQVALGMLSHVVFLGGVFAAAAAGLDAGVSALVCALQPMLVAVAGRVWFQDHVTAKQLLGLGVGIAGVAASVGGLGGSGLGAMWMVLASLVSLCAAALLERAWQPQASVSSSLVIQMSTAALAFTGWAACTSGLHVHATRDFVAVITWLVALSGFGGYATFTVCLRRLGATPTSTLLYLTPAVTMLWAWAMFAQTPTIVQMIGLFIVFIGVAISFSGTRCQTRAAVQV